jgi:hypothetical protein
MAPPMAVVRRPAFPDFAIQTDLNVRVTQTEALTVHK